MVAFFLGDGFYAIDNRLKKIIDHLWNHYSDGFTFLFSLAAGRWLHLLINLFCFLSTFFLVTALTS
ncbi:hypothetical protein QWZ08_13025 [Ferruginibacter paludis]|uniref:hypothetical protein n=1 Tax=Ferruginibacter paludis TaxID=1310417 RepID=UPI0025B3D35C|nr:hypothetical protein [Ferruginibacter paludis]MDN3656561.1 hypothetical protein [Ferruginibacter paludis]